MQAVIIQALAEFSFTAIDFETANERRASACAVGVVQVRHGRITDTFQTLLRPRELRVDWRNQQAHGISEADLHDAPSLADVWPQLLPYLYQQPVVAHNSAFDVSVLEHSLRDHDLEVPPFHCLCSEAGQGVLAAAGAAPAQPSGRLLRPGIAAPRCPVGCPRLRRNYAPGPARRHVPTPLLPAARADRRAGAASGKTEQLVGAACL